MDEIYESNCLETLEQYGFSNLTETFLTIDANKDNIITKKEGEDAAMTMMEDFNRKGYIPPNIFKAKGREA